MATNTVPHVSVVVPLYNKAPYVLRALNSIYAQTYGDFDVIVVDDGSTDGSREIVQTAMKDGTTLICQPNAGPGAARNRGAAASRAKYIAFLDADDEWLPDHLSRSVAVLERERVPALLCGMRMEPQGRCLREVWRHIAGVFRVTPESAQSDVLAILGTAHPPTTVIRRDVLLTCGGFYDRDGCRYGEDAHLMLRYLLHYPLYLDYRDGAIMYTAASQLSHNYANVRPVEPFLADPEALLRHCPAPLLPLVRSVLAARAIKTAAVYGYFGRAADARSLLRTHVGVGDFRSPLAIAALFGCTPVGGWIGAAHRTLRRRTASVPTPGAARTVPEPPVQQIPHKKERADGAAA